MPTEEELQQVNDQLAALAPDPPAFDEDLFAAYTVNKKPVSKDAFRDALVKRFQDAGIDEINQTELGYLSDYIYNNIPETARTSELARVIDVRPYIETQDVHDRAWIESKPRDQWTAYDKRAYEGTVKTKSVNTALATAEYTNFVNYVQTTTGKTVAVPGFSPRSVSVGPAATRDKMQTGNVAAVDQAFQGTAAYDRSRISSDDLRKAFIHSYSTDVLDIVQLENQYVQSGLIVTPTQIQMRTIDPRAGQSYVGARVNLSVPQASNYLIDASHRPSEITQMQKNLAAAGYFDTSTTGYVAGDAYDPETLKAWNAMLADSVKMNLPIDQLLREKTISRNQNFDAGATLTAASTFNQIGQQLLGRDLSAEEQANVFEYIKNLRDTKGLQTTDAATLKSGIDLQAAQDYIVSTTGNEQDMLSNQSQIDAFQKAFGS